MNEGKVSGNVKGAEIEPGDMLSRVVPGDVLSQTETTLTISTINFFQSPYSNSKLKHSNLNSHCLYGYRMLNWLDISGENEKKRQTEDTIVIFLQMILTSRWP